MKGPANGPTFSVLRAFLMAHLAALLSLLAPLLLVALAMGAQHVLSVVLLR